MISLRSDREIALLREANQRVADVLATLADMVKPGMTTAKLDATAHAMITEAGDRPAFLGYRGYPNTTCISVENEVVHGIPGPRKLRQGELVSIDVGVVHKGYVGDAALTVACGETDSERTRLMRTTDAALAAGIVAARPGNHLEDVSEAIQRTVEDAGFSVVRVFTGHGIGTEMHEDPQILNYVTGNPGPLLKPGMVLALEPMVNMGGAGVKVLDDGWTAVTKDGQPSAHFEHSIVVGEENAEILSRSMRRTWGV